MSSPPSDTPERNYPLIKIVAGDYLLPGNDARTLWRIRRYEEEFVLEDWRKPSQIFRPGPTARA